MKQAKIDIYDDPVIEIIVLKLSVPDDTGKEIEVEFGLLPHSAVNVATTILAHTLKFLQPKKEN